MEDEEYEDVLVVSYTDPTSSDWQLSTQSRDQILDKSFKLEILFQEGIHMEVQDMIKQPDFKSKQNGMWVDLQKSLRKRNEEAGPDFSKRVGYITHAVPGNPGNHLLYILHETTLLAVTTEGHILETED